MAHKMPDPQQIPSELPVLYVNFVRIAVGLTEVRLFLGETVPSAFADTPGEQPLSQKNIDRLCVVLSPEALPSIINALSASMTTYQSRFGQIRPMPAPAPTEPETNKAKATTQ